MAERNSSSTLSEDVTSIISLSYQIEAILAGAASLLEEHVLNAPGDRQGQMFNALQLVELAAGKAKQIYCGGDDLKISARLKALEVAEVCHG